MKHYSVLEYARMRGISRVAALKRITTGRIKAVKVGRAYIVSEKAILKEKAYEIAKSKLKDRYEKTKRAL